MLSTGLNTVTNLANNIGKRDFAYGGQPVYFDFLGGSFAEMKLGVLWIWNLILLVLGPWLLGASFYGRITVFGKVMLKGLGVASSAVLGSCIIVLVSMAIFSTTSSAVTPPHVILRLLIIVGVCTSYARACVFIAFNIHDILSYHPIALSPSTSDPTKSR